MDPNPQPNQTPLPEYPQQPQAQPIAQPQQSFRPEPQIQPQPVSQPFPQPSFLQQPQQQVVQTPVPPSRVNDLMGVYNPVPPPAKPPFPKKKLIALIGIVLAVIIIVAVAVLVMGGKDSKTSSKSEDSTQLTKTNYTGMSPVDIFNNLITEFKQDSAVVAGPIHKGVDAGGSPYDNITTVYESSGKHFLWVASGLGGVKFTVSGEPSEGVACKQRLSGVDGYRAKVVSALGQAGFKAVNTQFDDTKSRTGEAICAENTAYYSDATKIYCSEGRSTEGKSVSFDIACTDQKRGDSKIELSKELAPLLKSKKVATDSYIFIGSPKTSTPGYETLIILVKPLTAGLSDVGAFHNTDQPWKLLPGNASGVNMACSLARTDPEISKAYAGADCIGDAPDFKPGKF